MRRTTRTKLLVAATLTAAAAGSVAVVQSASAVARGEDVAEGSYRFSTQLTMTGIPTADGGKRNSACSGGLIAPEWIITAGHCFRDAAGVRVDRPVADSTVATLGRATIADGSGERRDVVEVKQYAGGDIAVARLSGPITGIEPLRIADSAPEVGDVVRITGWGADTGTNPAPSTQLRTGQFTVTTVEDAVVTVSGLAPASDTSACAYDSGAPYFTETDNVTPTLVSVESDGPTCPHSSPETTARVDTAADWINSVIG